ncbi:hypothetical protein PbJCM13498_28100 [Prolixibacter bellariivorans]|uniref:Uncharacterized protein n=1 Tax=Prolixibacter bellariivorans TaxID=314319 RepID=A0A5M4B2R2_9BACT|nr:hypothetical protein PbJCM13498_28100 [Prolixibacter bellariivorans]
MAEAIPVCCLLTEPITEFVFGEENSPNPLPIIAKLTPIKMFEVDSAIKVSITSPITVMLMPIVDKTRGSILSDQRPENVEKIVINTG